MIKRRNGRARCALRNGLNEKHCAYCGSEGTTADHIIPLCKDGDDALWNIVSSCENCNNEKGGDDFLVYLNKKKISYSGVCRFIEEVRFDKIDHSKIKIEKWSLDHYFNKEILQTIFYRLKYDNKYLTQYTLVVKEQDHLMINRGLLGNVLGMAFTIDKAERLTFPKKYDILFKS